jgi:hypothetical protein
VTTVYEVVNTVNGKIYIGKTSRGYLKRWKEHLYNARKGAKTPFHRAIRRYGDDQFKIKSLCDIEDEHADFVEILFIAAAQSFPPSLGYGYNAHPGGKVEIDLLPIDTAKYGRLSIIKMLPRYRCVVQCDCGSEAKIVAYDSLIREKTRSCGCIRKEKRHRSYIPGIGLRNLVFDRYQAQPKWLLTSAEFDVLIQSNCCYCGNFPSILQMANWTDVIFVYSEIVRKDPFLSFTPDNVVPCCKTCRVVRKELDHEQFLAFLLRAGQFQTNISSLYAKV